MELCRIDLGVVLAGCVALSCWGTYMIYNFTKAISVTLKNEDWRKPCYIFCAQVIATMAMLIGGFLIITG